MTNRLKQRIARWWDKQSIATRTVIFQLVMTIFALMLFITALHAEQHILAP